MSEAYNSRGFADGKKARLPFRWPQRETGKTAMFLMPSGPVNTRPALAK
jgi:hypothetical protein